MEVVCHAVCLTHAVVTGLEALVFCLALSTRCEFRAARVLWSGVTFGQLFLEFVFSHWTIL